MQNNHFTTVIQYSIDLVFCEQKVGYIFKISDLNNVIHAVLPLCSICFTVYFIYISWLNVDMNVLITCMFINLRVFIDVEQISFV